jgi:hypothetical protein
MTQAYLNNAKSTLSVGVSSFDTLIPVEDTTSFAVVAGGDFYLVTLQYQDSIEIIRIVAPGISGNNLTVGARGVEGTTPLGFPTGTRVECRFTAGTLELVRLTSATDIADEITRALGAEAFVSSIVSTEIINRLNADTNLQTQITNEVTRATTAETTTANALSTEITRATTAEITTANALSTEITNRTNADTNLQAQITNEVTRATTAETTAANARSTEITNRTNADTNLQAQITNEVTRATTAETTAANARSTEITNRTNADTNLQAQITNEGTRATTAEITTANALSTEITNRTNALSTEITNRTNADTNLQAQITAVQGLGNGQIWKWWGTYRNVNVTYTNTTGKPIALYIYGNSTNTAVVALNIGPTVTGTSQLEIHWSVFNNTPTTPCTVYCIIPINGTYLVPSGNSIVKWYELSSDAPPILF